MGQSKIDNPEKLATQGTQDKYTLENTERANWKHMVHKMKKNKQKHNTICVVHQNIQ